MTHESYEFHEEHVLTHESHEVHEFVFLAAAEIPGKAAEKLGKAADFPGRSFPGPKCRMFRFHLVPLAHRR